MAPTPQQTALWDAIDEYNNRVQTGGASNPYLRQSLGRAIIDHAQQTGGDAAAAKVRAMIDKGGPVDASAVELAIGPAASGTPKSDTTGGTSPAPSPDQGVPNGGETNTGTEGDAPSGRAAIAPGGGRAWLQGDLQTQIRDDENSHITELDSQIQQLNSSHFAVDPTAAWHLGGAQLPTGSNIAGFDKTREVSRAAANALSSIIQRLDAAYKSDERYITEEHKKQALIFIAANDSLLEFARTVPAQLKQAGDAGRSMFAALHTNMKQTRVDIGTIADQRAKEYANTAPTDERNLNLTGQQMTMMSNMFAKVSFNADLGTGAGDRISSAANVIRAATASAKTVTAATSNTPAAPTAPAPTSPGGKVTPTNPNGTSSLSTGGTTGSTPGKSTGTKNSSTTPGSATSPGAGKTSTTPSSSTNNGALNSAIADLLKQPATAPQQQSPMSAAQMPQTQMPQMPTTGAATPSQVSTPAQQLGQALGAGLNELAHDDSTTPEDTDHDSDEPATTHGPVAAATSADRQAVSNTPPSNQPQATEAKPGDPARKHQLDALGKPVDANGDGKVDEGTTPVNKHTVKPLELQLDSDGHKLTVNAPDPRLAEMVLNIAGGTEEDPISVLDAAEQSGIPTDTLVEKDRDDIAPLDAVVGDDYSGIYLGDDTVLTSTGDLVDLDEVLGDDGVVAEVPLPELPDGTDTTGPDQPAAAHNDNTPPAAAPGSTDTSGQAPLTTQHDTISAPDTTAATTAAQNTAPTATAPQPAAPAPAATPPAPAPAPAAAATSDSPQKKEDGPALVPFEGRALG